MRFFQNPFTLTATAAALILTSASCSEEAKLSSPAKSATIIATAGNPDLSRTAIDPTVYDDGRVGILWTDGDCIGIYSDQAKNRLFTTTQTGGRVPFTGNLSATDTPRYAYYPYSETNDGRDVTNLSGHLPTAQTWTTDGPIDGDYKYGKLRNNTDNEFDFTNLFALLRFDVNATGTDLAGENLKSVQITLPTGRTLGSDFTFDATTGSYTMLGGDNTNTITLSWTETPSLSDGTTITGYASCAADIRANDPITVIVTTNRKKATFNATAAYSFTDDCLYTFSLTLRNYADSEHGFTIEAIGTPDPEEEETANCYMITTTGEHNFCATVIGNGAKGIIKGVGFHTEDPYINPQSAKLLWEDVNGFITDVELRDGRVHYTTTGNIGNALIAVYSGPDCTGSILWSWHIWGVGDTLPQDEEITNYNGAKFLVMNRTLGSRSDHPGYATLYQWGRKDPLPNEDTIYIDDTEVNTYDSDYHFYDVINFTSDNQSEATIAGSIEHPTTYFDLSKNLSKGDWLLTENLYLWGNNAYKDVNQADETAQTHGKTIYDPSPVGYRVPNCFTFSFFCKNESGSNESVGNYRADYTNYVKYDNGYYFSRNESDTEGSLFPMSASRSGYYGMIHSYTGSGSKRVYTTNVDVIANYWYSNPQPASSGASQSMHLYLTKYVEFNTGSTTVNSNNKINIYKFSARCMANAIRCVRE